MKRTIVRGGLIALLTSVLVACGGGGSDGIDGTPGAPGSTTTVTSPGIQAGALSSAEWAALQLKGQITAVTLGGPPAVTFTLTDQNGNAIVGLENFYSKIRRQGPADAEDRDGRDRQAGAGHERQSQQVGQLHRGDGRCHEDRRVVLGLATPTTDSNGTLTYLGGGQYKYVFATDITKVKAFVDASSDANKADVGDTTYEPSLPHPRGGPDRRRGARHRHQYAGRRDRWRRR